MTEATVTNIPTEANGLARLREPFPAAVIGKLPRVSCSKCRDRTCQEHKKSKCSTCGNYITSAHIHLDYVGHAELTDRLLSVDPLWTWEPVAFDERGLPAMSKGAGGELTLWIRLTVCGVTRLGVGSVASGAFDSEKQLIGDALRNAAMRFGVALDLWAKEELESTLDVPTPPPGVDPATGAISSGGEQGASPPPPAAPPAPVRRPPPGRAKKGGADESTSVEGDRAGAEVAAAPANQIDHIRRQAAKKGLGDVELRAMAHGKELGGLAIAEANALTAAVGAHEAKA